MMADASDDTYAYDLARGVLVLIFQESLSRGDGLAVVRLIQLSDLDSNVLSTSDHRVSTGRHDEL